MSENSRDIIKARVFKKMDELKKELSMQRMFLDRLFDGRIKVKRTTYKKYQWYYEAEDEISGVRHYDFRKK